MRPTFTHWVITSLLLALALSFTAFTSKPSGTYESITENIRQSYIYGLDAFYEEVKVLNQMAGQLADGEVQIESLRTQLFTTRDAFKKIEFLAAYYDDEFISLYVNGAPLPRITKDDNRSITQPKGLQILEENIFADEPDASEIKALTGDLQTHVKAFLSIQRVPPLYDRYVFEASRFELIRIFSLGLTGFDTPITLRGIEESQTALKAVRDAISLYDGLVSERNPGLAEEISNNFEGALTYLEENQDFDSFDRLSFLTKYLNPLFRDLLKAHKVLGIETIEETAPAGQKFSFNYDAENIFSNDLINPFFYTEQIESQYSDEVVELGKLLFFDPILSDKAERSCASCHQPEKAFTDGRRKSLARGFDGTVDRNSPTLLNAVYSSRYFYDLRAEKLEKQIHHVLFDDREFNTDFFQVISRLSKSEEYRMYFAELFPQFGANPINRYSIATAISSYIISLRGWDSPFDQYVRGEKKELPENVKRGFNLFMGKAGCGTCHFAPTFNGLVPPLYQENESEILGVPDSKGPQNMKLDEDPGRFLGLLQEQFEIYLHSFKTVTVRNIEKTAPYMHNGVYDKLEEVMDFYNKGGGAGMGLEVPYQTLPPDPLDLSEGEIADMIAFMKALTNTDLDRHTKPKKLPAFPEGSKFNNRVVGGVY